MVGNQPREPRADGVAEGDDADPRKETVLRCDGRKGVRYSRSREEFPALAPAAFDKNAKTPNMLGLADTRSSKCACGYMTDSIRYIVGVNESSISVIKMGG